MNTVAFLRSPRALIAVLLFMALCALAFLLDIRRRQAGEPHRAATVQEEVAAAVRGLAGTPLAAPSGRFTIVPPADWNVRRAPDADGYDLVFWSFQGATLSAMATPVPYSEMSKLSDDILRRERERDLATPLELVTLGDRKMIQRAATLTTQRILAFDFVEHNVAYHVLCSAPTEIFPSYEGLFKELVKTLSPVQPASGANNAVAP